MGCFDARKLGWLLAVGLGASACFSDLEGYQLAAHDGGSGGNETTGGNNGAGASAVGGSNGGTASGGAGGSPNSGGRSTDGGTNTGGTFNTGGANTGGANTGGANTGGTNTGGANAGGANTGGANTGGSGGGTGAPPSCTGLPRTCGASATDDCCSTLAVSGGAFSMGRSTSGTDADASGNSDEQPEHSVTVTAYYLDKYEVTLGRFRKFVAGYPANTPADGSGAHPNVPGTAWQSAWSGNLPVSQAALISNLKCSTVWTDTVGSNENQPLNCVSWYAAMAFCIWDGGRLPTEAEWEYAAAGGGENRLYPWGAASATCALANMAGCAGTTEDVGSHPTGAGRWGHLDLGGNLWEWVFDWYDASFYSNASATGTDVVNLTSAANKAIRGGYLNDSASNLRAANRDGVDPPTSHTFYTGFRCARNP